MGWGEGAKKLHIHIITDRQSLLVTLTFAILNNMPGVIAAPYVLLGMCQTAHSNRVPGATVHLERKFSIAIILLFILPLYFFIFIKNKRICPKSSSGWVSKLPRSYPLIGSSLAIIANKGRYSQWFAEILSQCPTRTFVFHRALGKRQIVTANPSNVQHILKTKFSLYPKGDFFTTTLVDFLGNGISNADGANWKFGRQISSHEFNTKSLRNFVETVVDSELSNRLIPILSDAAANNSVLDLQDILQRFAFDNICKIAFGFDPEYLSPSLPQPAFAAAFEDAVRISSERFGYIFPATWKLKRALNLGSEKQLKQAISQTREFAQNIVKEKKARTKRQVLSRNRQSSFKDHEFRPFR
ncbi:hypothetical protein IFM89_007514 [Coptis chinensis]|uniref:Cytochrome P450 n=1 Tax=Coptis chinensis TaxID=261450 RepID=A0A835I2Y7_9MAGN|nr:hypothetical protein IFM89_007514 [Coptis chinensis]